MDNISSSSSKNSSPRISFSHDLTQSDHLPSSPRKPNNSPSSDFDFNVSLEIITAQDPGPADELFSGGKILPLPLKTPNPDPDPDPDPDPSPNSTARSTNGGQKSFWQFGRSSSLNCIGSRMKIKFPRSKSAGSDPNQNPNPKQQRGNVKKSYYYSGEKKAVCGGNRGRIGPVPLFPKERNGTGVIGFLLCSCGDNRMEYYCSP